MKITTDKTFEQVKAEILAECIMVAGKSQTNPRYPMTVYVESDGTVGSYHNVYGYSGDLETFAIMDSNGGVNWGDDWYDDETETVIITDEELDETGWFDHLHTVKDMMDHDVEISDEF